MKELKMVRLVIFIAFVLHASAKLNTNRHLLDGRIVGGRDADILNFPHQVSIQWYGGHQCGGSIISENYVVTAAHCVEPALLREFNIRANTSTINSGGIEVGLNAIYKHPQYNHPINDYDIAIVELSEPLIFGPGINAIALPNLNDNIPDGTEVSVIGWGKLGELIIGMSEQLQVVEVNIINRDVCQSDYDSKDAIVNDRMICAGVDEGGKDACSGDSGGPLFADGILWGIVCWGNGCAEKEYPGVYTSVAALRDYVTEITGF